MSKALPLIESGSVSDAAVIYTCVLLLYLLIVAGPVLFHVNTRFDNSLSLAQSPAFIFLNIIIVFASVTLLMLIFLQVTFESV